MFARQVTQEACSPVFSAVAAVALALLATACDKDGEKKVSQVVAKVDGVEITVHQLNAELGRLNAPVTTDPKVADNVSIGVLRNLVDQQLFVALAKEKNLERDPNVVLAIEQAKRQILAQTYAKQLVGDVKSPDDKEVAAYYDKHTELFKNRKIFTMRILAVSKQGLKPEILDTLEKINTLADAEAYLQRQNIAYQQRMVTSPSEDLPMGILPRMVGAPTGQMFLLNMSEQIAAYDIIKAIDQPMALEQAKPIISRFLISQASEKRVRDEIERLHKTANIEYMGKFSDLKPDVIVETPVVNSANASAAGADTGASSQSLERGLSGLK